MEVITKVCNSGVLKKFWSYIKPKSNRITILIKIKMECDERDLPAGQAGNKNGKVDVEVECKTKTELIDSIAASAKLSKADAGRTMEGLIQATVLLKNFKATEPEI